MDLNVILDMLVAHTAGISFLTYSQVPDNKRP